MCIILFFTDYSTLADNILRSNNNSVLTLSATPGKRLKTENRQDLSSLILQLT